MCISGAGFFALQPVSLNDQCTAANVGILNLEQLIISNLSFNDSA